jgi:hypothetical protein
MIEVTASALGAHPFLLLKLGEIVRGFPARRTAL